MHVFHVTVTKLNVNNAFQILMLFSDLQGRQLTDTAGFDFDFEHYKL